MPEVRMASPWFKVLGRPFQRLSGSKINVQAHTTLPLLAAVYPLVMLVEVRGKETRCNYLPPSKWDIGCNKMEDIFQKHQLICMVPAAQKHVR